MPLIADELTVWDISFRWAGYDPTKFWFRLPLAVKDNSRLLMHAILHGEVVCETITLAKLPPDSKADPKYYIRTYTDEIYACIHGVRYNRKLLRWSAINRMDFNEWCERRGIPPPEFWFPPGWKLDFEMPEFGTVAMWATHIEPKNEGDYAIRYDHPDFVRYRENRDEQRNSPDSKTQREETNQSEPPESGKILRINQQIRIACQQIAREIWKKEPHRTIASVVVDELIQEYGGAAPYNEDTVREWIKEVAPLEVSKRRGRPRKIGIKNVS